MTCLVAVLGLPVPGVRSGKAHVGAVKVLVRVQERLMEASDAFRVHVDTKSGLLAAANLKNQTFTSLTGNKSAEIVQVYMPYACKLLFQEMMAMCIVPRMRFDEPKGER